MFDDLDWLDETTLGEALCLTVARGVTVAEALAAFGADAADSAPLDDLYGDGVALIEIPDGVLALEPNGYLGAQAEVLAALSASGTAACMYWNVNYDTSLSWARDGELIASFDLLDEDADDRQALPADLLPLAALADDEDEDPRRIGLALVERLTGVTLTADAITSVETGYRIQD